MCKGLNVHGLYAWMVNLMASIKVIKCKYWIETQQYEFVDLHNIKAPCKEKTLKQIVESLHLNIMLLFIMCILKHITQVGNE